MVSIWYKGILVLLHCKVTKFQRKAHNLAILFESSISSSNFLVSHLSKELKERVISSLLGYMEERGKDPMLILNIWSHFVTVLGQSLHKHSSFLNEMLRVVEMVGVATCYPCLSPLSPSLHFLFFHPHSLSLALTITPPPSHPHSLPLPSSYHHSPSLPPSLSLPLPLTITLALSLSLPPLLSLSLFLSLTQGFKHKVFLVQVTAYNSWRALINNFSIDINLLTQQRRLKLLLMPLVASAVKDRHHQVETARLHTWWHLIKKLGMSRKDLFNQVHGKMCAQSKPSKWWTLPFFPLCFSLHVVCYMYIYVIVHVHETKVHRANQANGGHFLPSLFFLACSVLHVYIRDCSCT